MQNLLEFIKKMFKKLKKLNKKRFKRMIKERLIKEQRKVG